MFRNLVVIFSLLMALHLVAGSFYGFIQPAAEELVEKNPLQEQLEKDLEKKVDYYIHLYSFRALDKKEAQLVHQAHWDEEFFGFVREVPPPPPDLV
ncbi:hypothetical protein CLV31_10323 [Algoriphagus aquaeductus]|uniref:Uncharacterized protein n=1 Tax=Algoriphagus aquaeductus TaxID=475299 RepID=A0A326RUL3_9BACT|nr:MULTISPECIES: hypothetical protein [Algoriphagus]PZV85234.1 hypothetical protein CLV31_10323 [Algoriphagus aquaeductus]